MYMSNLTRADRDSKSCKKSHKDMTFYIIFTVLIIIFGGVGLIINFNSQQEAVAAFAYSYDMTYSDTVENVKEEFREKGYDYAEQKYHTSNSVQIEVDDIKSRNSLEVLKASDTFLKVTESDKDNSSQRWVEIPGTAVFTVDLSMSEIIKDEYNKYVLVRVNAPELTNIKIDYGSCKIDLYNHETGFLDINGNYEEGADEAQSDYAEAYGELRDRFYNDQKFYIAAENSAKNLITALIKNLNPEISDLKVEVEFV